MSDWGWVAIGYSATIAATSAYTASIVMRRRKLLDRIAQLRGQERP